MTDVQSKLIAGRWVVPPLVLLDGQLLVRVSIGMETLGELPGNAIGVQRKSGVQLIPQLRVLMKWIRP